MKLIKNANIGKATQELYSNTSLQHHFGINLTLLADGKKTSSIYLGKSNECLPLEHLRTTISKSHEFDYKKSWEGEIEIAEGFFKSISKYRRNYNFNKRQ